MYLSSLQNMRGQIIKDITLSLKKIVNFQGQELEQISTTSNVIYLLKNLQLIALY